MNAIVKNSPAAQNIEGTIHVDRYLTNFSVAYVQDAKNFVAQRASSVISVNKQTDMYVEYDRGYFWRDEAEPRPLGGRPVQVSYKVNSGTYSAIEYALEHVIDDRQRANADEPIRLDENASRLLTQKHMIKQDRIWCQSFFKAGVWTNDFTGVTSSPSGALQFLQFNDSNSDPISVIDAAKDYIHQRTGFMPNTLVLGAGVKRVLRTHPDISDRIKYTRTGIADEQILGSLFEVDNVVVARGIYNSANEGATNSFQYIADRTGFWLGYVDPNPSLDSPTAIAQFAWTGLIPGETNALGGVMERGRDNRAHSDWFQERMAWDLKLVAADLGAYFASAIDGAAAPGV
jgi:hypothetical protein